MENDNDPISELVELYKGAYLSARLWQEVAAIYSQGRIPGPTLERTKQRLQPQVEQLFAEYDQRRQFGLPSLEALRVLLPTLRRLP